MIKDLLSRIVMSVPRGRSFLYGRANSVAQPDHPQARVVISALGAGGLGGIGKADGWRFFPAFCDELRRRGIATHYACSLAELERLADPATVLLNIYGEDFEDIRSPRLREIEERCRMVFNSADIGPVIADKAASHEAFLAGGIPTPKRAERGFTRQRHGTHEPTAMGAAASETQFTTDFVDTRVTVAGKTYYTCLRALCVDDIVLQAYVRARDAEEGIPDVHNGDTPLDPDLIETLHARLVTAKMDQIEDIAARLHARFGHGFFAHDLLVDQAGRVSICETGFKFDDYSYTGHLAPVAQDIPSIAPLFPAEAFARRSARVFAGRITPSASDDGT